MGRLNTVQRIFKNTSVELAAQLLGFVATMALAVFLPRYLGPELYGKYSLAASFTAVFGILSGYGFGVLITRDVARDRELAGPFLGTMLPLQVGFAVGSVALMVVAVWVFRYPRDTTMAIYFIGGQVVFMQLYTSVSAVYRAFERMELNSLFVVGSRFLYSAVAIGLLLAGYRLMPLVAWAAVLAAVQFGLSLWVLRRTIAPVLWKVSLSLWRYALKEGSPFAVAAFFATFRLSLGVIILSKLTDASSVGIYNAAFRPCVLLSFIAIAYANALFPLMSRLGATSRSRLLAVYQFAFKTVMLVALPAAAGATLLADRLVPLVYGNDYLASIPALQILVWMVPSLFLVYPMGNVLVAIDKAYLATVALVVDGVVALGLNALLIAQFGYLGAAVGMATSEMLLAFLYFVFIRKHLGSISMSDVFVKPLVITLLMGIVVYGLSSIAWPLSIATGLVFCVAMVWALRVFSHEELGWFRRLMSRGTPTLESVRSA